MKKRLLAIATLAALPVASFAGSAEVSGFADIKYTADKDKSYFTANAEVDVQNKMSDKVSVRIDTDLAIAGNGGANAGLSGPADSAVIEQAYFDFAAHKSVTIRGGVFNNPIGLQAEDSIDRNSINSDRVYGVLDGQTALYGNNVAGAAAIVSAGPATIIVGALNDLGHNDLETNSYALVAAVSPMKGLDLELGYVTQAENDAAKAPTSAGNVLDVNVKYAVAGATIGFDYLMPSDVVESAMAFTVGYDVTKAIGVSLLWDSVTNDDDNIDATDETTTAMGIGGSLKLADNLKVKAEYYTISDAAGDDDAKVNVKFLASF